MHYILIILFSDISGVHSNYQSNTLTAGGGSLGGSSMGYSGGVSGVGGGAGGFSTMSSSYNYSVKTVSFQNIVNWH